LVSRDAKWSAFVAAFLAFVSAALLFSVQPHLGKKLLPTVGGGPAVWNACLVFFQAALLLGYTYAWQLRRRQTRRMEAVHAVALLAACGWLFIAPPPNLHSAGGSPTLQSLLSLVVIAALPAVALSATTPMLHRSAGGYRIYAASNAGSLFALALYPFVIEPNLGLEAQWTSWRMAFVVFAAAMIAFGLTRPLTETPSTTAESRPPDPGRWRWLFWSGLPSALLVSTTQHITEDVAGGPLLWIPPLALFLLASIVVFADSSPPQGAFLWLLSLLLLARGSTLVISNFAPSFWIPLAVELAVLFVAALASFAELYRSRPSDVESSAFYLWIALGGALGGTFATLLCPHLFRSIAEHPFLLLLLCLFLPCGGRLSSSYATAIAVLAGVTLLYVTVFRKGDEASSLEFALLVGAFGMLLAIAFRRRAAWGAVIGMPFAWIPLPDHRHPVYAERSEFGVHQVTAILDESGGRLHALRHGGINHGWQNREPGRTQEALGYYHPQSAVGEALDWRTRTSKGGDIAVVGLGAGAALVHRRSDQRFVFLEIDPSVVRIAGNPKFFSFLEEANGHVEIRIGDGRFLLSKAPDASVETIFLDAFTGDAVPTHLLTREAFAMYVQKLKSGGVIIVNITNWFVDLEDVTVRVAESLGLACIGKNQTAGRTGSEIRPAASRCLVVSRDANQWSDLARADGWERKTASPKSPLWTDDFSDVWTVIRWR